MNLNNLPKTTEVKRKRMGRGLGSGKGKTGGRGTKGQKARDTIKPNFNGGVAMYKKLPLKRGKGNPNFSAKVFVLNIEDLKGFKANTVIDINVLIDQSVITKDDAKKEVKVLGFGEINVPLVLRLPVSKQARQKIEAAGGKVENE